MKWKAALLIVLFTIVSCSSGPALEGDSFDEQVANLAGGDTGSDGDAFFEEGFDESIVNNALQDAPDPEYIPEEPKAVSTPNYNNQNYTPPAPPTQSSSVAKSAYSGFTSDLNIGSGRMLSVKKTCSVYQRPSDGARIHNTISDYRRLWVEPSSNTRWVTVQRTSGPAYMKATCFM